MDENGDGLIEVGELVGFLMVIQVHNSSGDNWTNVRVKDRFGAELDVTSANPSQGTATLTTKGKSEKEFLEWDVGDLAPGDTANLVIMVNTDLNPAGHQEYTSTGIHCVNSGATLKYIVSGHQESATTGSICLEVV
jgi:hypothetical protein